MISSLKMSEIVRHRDVEGSADPACDNPPTSMADDAKKPGDGDSDQQATLTHLGGGTAGDATGTGQAGHATPGAAGTATATGRFRVLRPHARGGLGVVSVALDEELHREVALKQILERQADNPTSRRRFLLEAEITGGLEHPGIVPVYGLGADAEGRPYYAMRFIQGDTLGDAIARFHADVSLKTDPGRRALALQKLLRRFLDVCNAIDYAHARGVLHRDIKPANVIVGRHGETLVVDWGLAKVRGQADAVPSEERPLRTTLSSGDTGTLAGSTLGTPAYMSPEQAKGDIEGLGAASDVYSLGATLYCLLTGRAPFEQADLTAVLRAVRRGEFPLPRRIDPSLDQALEAVCLKAMALAPENRYASARALAEDVEGFMADEPVTAWREPFARRVRRWTRRNRTAMTAAAVTAAAAVVGLATVAGVQTRANNKLTRSQAETQRALRQSEESRKQEEAVSEFLVQTFRSPDPSRNGRDVKVIDLLDGASERIDREFAGSQATRGSLRDALGRTYQGLGMFDRAVDLHTRARADLEASLGPENPRTLSSRSNLADSYQSAGRIAEAIALHESTLKLFESTLGPDHPETLQCRNDLGSDYWQAGDIPRATALYEETLKRREMTLGPEHPDTLQSRQNLAIAYSGSRPSEAIPMFVELLGIQEKTLGPNHPFTLETRNDLANVYRTTGRLSEATALDEETLRRREAHLGPDHPETLSSRGNLALDYSDAGRFAEAMALDQEILRRREAKLGPDHPETLISRINLAEAYRDAGRSREAIALNQTTLERLKASLGPDHPNTLICMSNMAASYLQGGRTAEAIALLGSTLKACEAKLGPSDAVTLWNRDNLATADESLGRWTDAERLRSDTLARRRTTEKPDGPFVAGDLTALGRNLLAQSRWAEAEPLLRQSLAIREQAAADSWERYETMSLLGGALSGQKHYVEAEPLLLPGYEGMKEREAKMPVPERFRVREAVTRVIRLYEGWGKPDKATEWKGKLAASRTLPG
jgi:tetratricopeptide (TPR) repeat protein/tRNA A-37 threonylcarbamoyl transferase component Bud32